MFNNPISDYFNEKVLGIKFQYILQNKSYLKLSECLIYITFSSDPYNRIFNYKISNHVSCIHFKNMENKCFYVSLAYNHKYIFYRYIKGYVKEVINI